MKADKYNAIAEKIKSYPYGVALVNGMSKAIVWITMGSYVALLAWLLFTKQYVQAYHCTLVPSVAFLVVSVFRHIYNAKRPYEEMEIQPLIEKDKKGQSFPSRHVFSSFMIGMAVLQEFPLWGMVLLVLGLSLAVLRVLVGVHYTRDVIAGASIGLLSGILGFYVIF